MDLIHRSELMNKLANVPLSGDAVTYAEKVFTIINCMAVIMIGNVSSAQPDIKEIGYADCADAMLKMWIDKILTDGEYNKIMDKLNKFWKER